MWLRLWRDCSLQQSSLVPSSCCGPSSRHVRPILLHSHTRALAIYHLPTSRLSALQRIYALCLSMRVFCGLQHVRDAACALESPRSRQRLRLPARQPGDCFSHKAASGRQGQVDGACCAALPRGSHCSCAARCTACAACCSQSPRTCYNVLSMHGASGTAEAKPKYWQRLLKVAERVLFRQ
jgi:hypothetical protein